MKRQRHTTEGPRGLKRPSGKSHRTPAWWRKLWDWIVRRERRHPDNLIYANPDILADLYEYHTGKRVPVQTGETIHGSAKVGLKTAGWQVGVRQTNTYLNKPKRIFAAIEKRLLREYPAIQIADLGERNNGPSYGWFEGDLSGTLHGDNVDVTLRARFGNDGELSVTLAAKVGFFSPTYVGVLASDETLAVANTRVLAVLGGASNTLSYGRIAVTPIVITLRGENL